MSLPGMPAAKSLSLDWGVIGKSESTANPGQRYRLAQYAYLRAVAARKDKAAIVANHVLNVLFDRFEARCDLTDPSVLASELQRSTLWDILRRQAELSELAPPWTADTFTELTKANHAEADRLLRRLSTHQELFGVLCRVDHPFIDLYALRYTGKEGEADADEAFHLSGKLI